MKSIVEYYAEHERYRCGYCRRPDSNYSHGMWAHTMTASDYQDLIDRGWRRSGKYCYKPTMDMTCCPMYTIRCQVGDFKTSKSQKKVLKRFNKYVMGQVTPETSGGDARKMSTCSSGSEMLGEGYDEAVDQFVETTREHQVIDLGDVIAAGEKPISPELEDTGGDDSIKDTVQDKTTNEHENLKPVRNILGPDPTKSQCRKAKEIRKERKLEKLKQKGVDIANLRTTNINKEKQIEDFVNELPDEYKNKLEIRLVRTSPPSPEWLATAKVSHEIYVKYQTIIHQDKPDKCTESKFNDFLVQSPLLEEYIEDGPSCGYGSFHQQYWLDGKLIAVGVIDILPKCVSSVYFFYDPQYMNLTMGTYGALREIEFTRHLSTECPELKYYYLGYYMHSCRKMRYKGNFHPSDLLCPETYKWFPLKDSIVKLELSPYSRLDPDLDSVDDNYPNKNDVNYVPVWVKGAIMHYKMYRRKSGKKDNDLDEVLAYAQLVGTKTAKSLVLVRSV